MNLAIVLASFLLGSIPFGYLLVRWKTGSDVRGTGSGNIGATNVARSLGPGAGLATFGLDALKGAGAVLLCREYDPSARSAIFGAAAAILGHVFSPWLGFRGGKGVATGFGAFAVLDPWVTMLAAAVFVVTVGLSRLVSLGSLAAAAAMPLLFWLRGRRRDEVAVALLVATLIAWRHRDNVARLRAGTEPRLGQPRSSAA